MRVTVIPEDNLIGIDGVFRSVDLSGMPSDMHAIQWNNSEGHIEYTDQRPNSRIQSFSVLEPYVALWNAAGSAPDPDPDPDPGPEPTPEQLRLAAHARINSAYEAAVTQLVAGYPRHEIDSWAKQEAEARAWVADHSVPTPWIDSAATTRGIPKPEFIAKVIEQADQLAPLHGALSGKRQYLRDRIDALVSPTQEQLDAIEW